MNIRANLCEAYTEAVIAERDASWKMKRLAAKLTEAEEKAAYLEALDRMKAKRLGITVEEVKRGEGQ